MEKKHKTNYIFSSSSCLSPEVKQSITRFVCSLESQVDRLVFLRAFLIFLIAFWKQDCNVKFEGTEKLNGIAEFIVVLLVTELL